MRLRGFARRQEFYGFCEPHRKMHDAVRWRSLFCLYLLRFVRAGAVLQCTLHLFGRVGPQVPRDCSS